MKWNEIIDTDETKQKIYKIQEIFFCLFSLLELIKRINSCIAIVQVSKFVELFTCSQNETNTNSLSYTTKKHIHTDRIMSIKLKLNDTNTIIRACVRTRRASDPTANPRNAIPCCHRQMDNIFPFFYLYVYIVIYQFLVYFFLSLNFRFCERFFFLVLLSFEMWLEMPSIWLDLLLDLANELNAGLYLVPGQN